MTQNTTRTMNKTMLVTGCSSGIGYHCAHGMKARGWQVIASCRKPEDVERMRTEGLESVLIDYEDDASIHAGFEAAMALSGGRIDALFNNGAYGIPGMTEDLPTDALRQIFEANFFGWHTLTRRVIPVMRAQKAGRIIQCSSVLGFAALKTRGAYNSTKFALEGLSDTMRMELAGTGIDVCLIEPGPVTSKIRENAAAHYEKWVKPGAENSVWKEFYRTELETRLYSAYKKDKYELGPEAVLKKLIHAAEATRPNPRYYVTTPTYVAGFLKRVLSTRRLDRILGGR